jgi:hypothetical protein
MLNYLRESGAQWTLVEDAVPRHPGIYRLIGQVKLEPEHGEFGTILGYDPVFYLTSSQEIWRQETLLLESYRYRSVNVEILSLDTKEHLARVCCTFPLFPSAYNTNRFTTPAEARMAIEGYIDSITVKDENGHWKLLCTAKDTPQIEDTCIACF